MVYKLSSPKLGNKDRRSFISMMEDKFDNNGVLNIAARRKYESIKCDVAKPTFQGDEATVQATIHNPKLPEPKQLTFKLHNFGGLWKLEPLSANPLELLGVGDDKDLGIDVNPESLIPKGCALDIKAHRFHGVEFQWRPIDAEDRSDALSWLFWLFAISADGSKWNEGNRGIGMELSGIANCEETFMLNRREFAAIAVASCLSLLGCGKSKPDASSLTEREITEFFSAVEEQDDALIVQRLIEAKPALINCKNEKGETPLKVAKAKGNDEVAAVLQKAGGHE